MMMPLVPRFSEMAALGAFPIVLAGVVMSYIIPQPSAGLRVTHLFAGRLDWLKNNRSTAPALNSVSGVHPTPGFPGTFLRDETAVLTRGGLLVLSAPAFLVNGSQYSAGWPLPPCWPHTNTLPVTVVAPMVF